MGGRGANGTNKGAGGANDPNVMTPAQSRQLERSKAKLERLEREHSEAWERASKHLALAHGSPVNDKRGGDAFLRRQDNMERKAYELSKELEKQRLRVESMEKRFTYGLTRSGGLEMSVANIPRIKKAIADAEAGKNTVKPATLRRWKSKLSELETSAKASKSAPKGNAKSIIASGQVTQWKKNPHIYFVNGFKKVALELGSDGNFKVSYKYFPYEAKAKAKVMSLLGVDKLL